MDNNIENVLKEANKASDVDVGVSSQSNTIQKPGSNSNSNSGAIIRNFSSVSVLQTAADLKDTAILKSSSSKDDLTQKPNIMSAINAEDLNLKHSESKSKLSGLSKTLDNVDNKKKISDILKQETFDFMVGIMDECTHLANFSVPVDPELIIIVAANQDAYVPRNQVQSLCDLWPGAEVRYIDRGHVTAFLMETPAFRFVFTCIWSLV